MTRINCGIPPVVLTDKHLLAEHREIKRIPNVIKRGRYSMKDKPNEFTLGKGHVKFFYDKQLYLYERYQELFLECKKRGFNVTDYSSAWDEMYPDLWNNYTPTIKDKKIVIDRIASKLNGVEKLQFITYGVALVFESA